MKKNEQLTDEDKKVLSEINAEKKKQSSIDLGKQCHAFSVMIYVEQLGYREQNLTNEQQINILKNWLIFYFHFLKN